MLRPITISATLTVLAWLGACATTPFDPQSVEDILVGTWTVDLRPLPDAEPYYQEFVVTAVDGNRFSGTFYSTSISEGRINVDWGTLRIAFVTVDGSGSYHHSAVLDHGTLDGLSNSTGRDFLSYWTAVKE